MYRFGINGLNFLESASQMFCVILRCVLAQSQQVSLKKVSIKIANNFHQSVYPNMTGHVAVNLHILEGLWLPDIEILDLKAFETHSLLS